MPIYSYHLQILKYLDRWSLKNMALSSKYGYDLVLSGKDKYNMRGYSSKRCKVFEIKFTDKKIISMYENAKQLYVDEILNDDVIMCKPEIADIIVKKLNKEKYIHDFKEKGIKKGDIIHVVNYTYRNDGRFLYNGQCIVDLYWNDYDYGTVTPEFTLEEYNTWYWKDAIPYGNFVYVNLFPYKQELLFNITINIKYYDDTDEIESYYRSYCKKWIILFEMETESNLDDILLTIQNIKNEVKLYSYLQPSDTTFNKSFNVDVIVIT